jgi:hypothetical protein
VFFGFLQMKYPPTFSFLLFFEISGWIHDLFMNSCWEGGGSHPLIIGNGQCFASEYTIFALSTSAFFLCSDQIRIRKNKNFSIKFLLLCNNVVSILFYYFTATRGQIFLFVV